MSKKVQKPSRPNGGYRQPSRQKTAMIAGHFDRDVTLALHELLGREGRKRGQRLTVQAALTEALLDYFHKLGAKPPRKLTPG